MLTSQKASERIKERNLDRAGAFDDLKKLRAIKQRYTILAILGFLGGLLLVYPLHILLFADGTGFGERLLFIRDYVWGGVLAALPGTGASTEAWARSTLGWYAQEAARGLSGQGQGIPPFRVAVVLAVWFTLVAAPLLIKSVRSQGLDPTPKIYGDTRWADETDVAKMSSKDLIGFDGALFVVGRLKGKFLRMKETLSVLLLAPPGTGKTVAFIVPSTVMMDRSCILLNDQKPELFHMTSGHRSSIGPVFQLMWSAQDMPAGGWMSEEQAALINPDLLDRDAQGNTIRDEGGAYQTRPIFFPSWNPIGPASIPSPGPRRDLYIERLASVLAPDPSGGGDKFWTSKARAAMIGLVHYLVAKVELGQDPLFPDVTEEGIPDMWRGNEPSFPMLVDWFTEAQNAVDDEEGDDPIRGLFKNAVAEAQRINKIYLEKHGVAIMNRAITELTALMNSPDKTRGSILSTLDEALGPFKNEAARQRTRTSSFSFKELRGSPKPEARQREQEKVRKAKEQGREYHPRYKRDEWDPITIYISINAEDARAFSTITGIFVDSANAYLVANGPNAIDDRGNQLGPYDFFFLLDETPTLPKLDTVMNGPAVGRSKRVSYAIVGQDFAQIETRYSKAEVETLKSTTAIKVVLSQNNETAARSISQMAGKMTYLKENYGFKDGDAVSKFMGQGKKEVVTGESWEGRDFIDISFVMAMPQDKHLVLVQNFMNRPILADTPKFFLVDEIKNKVYNLRDGKGPKPAFPMPKALMDQAAGILVKEQEHKKAAEDLQNALVNPEVSIVVTPQNISDVSRDLSQDDTPTNRNPPGNLFAVYKARMDSDHNVFPMPKNEDVLVTANMDALRAKVEGGRIFAFDENDVDLLMAGMASEDQPAPSRELFHAIKDQALAIDREERGDIFTIGYYGSTSLDPPMDGNEATPEFALRWMAEIATYVLSIEFEQARIREGK